MHAALLTLFLLPSAPTAVEPVNAGEAVKWASMKGHVLAPDGAEVVLKGPAHYVVLLAGERSLRGKKINVEIERDAAYRSVTEIAVGRQGKGPKGYPMHAAIDITVPDGEHRYRIRSSTTPLVVLVANTPLGSRPVTAGAEMALAPAAGAAPAAEAAPEEVAAAPAPPAEPTTTRDELIGQAQAMEVAGVASSIAEAPGASSAPALAVARRVAVYDLELENVPSNIGALVTSSLTVEVRKLQGLSVIGMEEVRQMLSFEASKQAMGCSDESCLAEIAGALGVDDLVTGRIARVDAGSEVVVIRRIDQREAKVVDMFQQRLEAGNGEEVLATLGPAIAQLFPERQLRPGAERGVAAEVALRLSPPPLPRWSTFGVAGGALAATVAGGIFGAMASSSEQSFNQLASSQGTLDGRDLVALENDANSRARNANIAFSAAGTLALSAVVMALFTDWHGYAAQASAYGHAGEP